MTQENEPTPLHGPHGTIAYNADGSKANPEPTVPKYTSCTLVNPNKVLEEALVSEVLRMFAHSPRYVILNSLEAFMNYATQPTDPDAPHRSGFMCNVLKQAAKEQLITKEVCESCIEAIEQFIGTSPCMLSFLSDLELTPYQIYTDWHNRHKLLAKAVRAREHKRKMVPMIVSQKEQERGGCND